ncbi:MAG TPA: urea amidolyase family protein [Humibacter sp.]|nr:urea amidolyase family protein [Humibacter sp.]
MRFLPVNIDAFLIELDDLEQTVALFESLTTRPIHGVTELVPAAMTILLVYRPSAVSAESIIAAIRARNLTSTLADDSTLIEIPVRYGGEDLIEVARLLGISEAELVRRHTAGNYRVAFTGFAPGFAYLTGGHPSLDVSRRSTPRTRIPAGAVGLAGTFSGIYPRESPGGWQIIGTTDLPMWDLAREVPALLQPGDRVRFVDVAGTTVRGTYATVPHGSVPPAHVVRPERLVDAAGTPSRGTDSHPAIEVRAVGAQTLLEDLGRPGRASLGVSPSGALDRASLREANRLVGNASDTAGLEVVDGGLRVISRGENVLAVTGAVPALTVTSEAGRSRRQSGYQAFALSDGDELVLGVPSRGIRSYVAIRGGFAIEPVLGSLSTDVLSGLGPPPITPGAVLPVRPIHTGMDAISLNSSAPDELPGIETVTLDLVLGPRTDWFTAEAVSALGQQVWTVTPQSNRVGLRLRGDVSLNRTITDELPSEGTVAGALQVPPDGQPVLFLADHPLTGGYPVIGAVAGYQLNLVGQIPVGGTIRFNPISEFGDLANRESSSVHTSIEEN